MTIKLRPYQKEAVEAALSTKDNALIVLPTGSGKSYVVNELIRKSKAKHCVIFQPRAHILKQNIASYEELLNKNDYAVMSASAGRCELGKITFATIGTAMNRIEQFKDTDLIIVDEAHNLTLERKTGQYLMFFKQLKYSGKIIGLTATPFRYYRKFDKSKMQTRPTIDVLTEVKKEKPFFKDICYLMNISDAIADGRLLQPTYELFKSNGKMLRKTADGSSYTKASIQEFDIEHQDKTVEICKIAYEEKSKIICFVETIEVADQVSEILQSQGINAKTVSSKRDKKYNDEVLDEFKNTKEKMILVNVNILTEGYDARECDGIVLSSPTASINRYIQRVGRALRPYGDPNPKIYDLAQSSLQFGQVEDIKIQKTSEGWIARNKKKILTGFQDEVSFEDIRERARKKSQEDEGSSSEVTQKTVFVPFRVARMRINEVTEPTLSRRGNYYVRLEVTVKNNGEYEDFTLLEMQYNPKNYFANKNLKEKRIPRKGEILDNIVCSISSNGDNFGFLNSYAFEKKV